MTTTKPARWIKTPDGYINGNILIYQKGQGDWKQWVIAHEPSRLGCGNFKTLKQCKDAVAALREQFDFGFMDRVSVKQGINDDYETLDRFAKAVKTMPGYKRF